MVWSDLHQLVGAILLIVGAVLPVINPPGDVPLFLALTEGLDDATRTNLARRVGTYSFGLLLGSMLLGSFILRLFDLSLAIVQVAGGAVACALGWKLLNQEDPPAPAGAPAAVVAPPDVIAKAFYPLTLPLTVDPASISVAIAVGANHAHGITREVVKLVADVVSSVIMAAVIYVAYRNAWRIARWMGERWMGVGVRLSAFIALCIGLQIMWNGTKGLVAELGVIQKAPASAPAPR